MTWDYPDLAYTWMLLLLSARASLWLLINLSASHERTRGVISTSQHEQHAQDHSSGLMGCYCSAADWYCWYEQPNLISTWWKSLWTSSKTINVCKGVKSLLKTALSGRLLVFSQDLKTTGKGYCFLWHTTTRENEIMPLLSTKCLTLSVV